MPKGAKRSAGLFFLTFILLPAVLCAQSGAPPTTSSGTNTAKPANGTGAGTAQTATIVKVTPVADYSKEPFVVELLEQKERFEADGKGQRELTLRVRVQSESAVRQFGLLVYPFASTFESLEVVYARVRKPDGTVIETPASDVQELDSAVSREAPMYTDEREKHVAIKSLTVGDILEAKFRWTVHDAMAPGHFWFDQSYFRDGICLKEVAELDVPRATPVKLHYEDPQPTVREEGERRIYTFQRANLKKREESKIPEWERDFHGANPPDLRISSFNSWEEVGDWFSALEKPKVAVEPEIRAKAEELTKGKSTEDEKIRALYDFVSTHIRYIGVDLGMGRYTPHAAADVLSNRYGDCKDKHTLFAALLQAVGIPAYPVLISSRYRLDVALPSPSLFDHVITAIPKGDGLMFLDTTPEVAPYGLLLANLRDRQTLVMPLDKAARLVTTPAEPPFHCYEVFHIDSSIDSKGTLDAEMLLEERSDSEVVLRAAYRATPQNKWDELTQQLVGRMGFAGTVSEVSVATPEDTAKPFTLAFHYHRTDFPDWKNRRIVLPAPPFFLAQLTEEQKLSKEPLPIGTSVEVTYDTKVKLPEKYFAVLPPAVQVKNDVAEFSATYALEKSNVLHGTLHLQTLTREIPGEERAKFSDLSTKVAETSNRYIFFSGDLPDETPVLRRMGKPTAATMEATIELLEKAVAENPSDQSKTLLLSRAYVASSRPKDAVILLEKTVAGKPEDAAAIYFVLAKAYLMLPDPEKAFETYGKVINDTSTPLQLNNAAWELGDAGVHLKEALDYAQRAVTAISKETKDISTDDAEASDFALMGQLAAYWDTLGWIKYRQGDVAGAEPYLQASWELGQFPIVGEHLAEVYEKLGKPQKAATVCNMAMAAQGRNNSDEKLSTEMDRLRQYLKPEPGHHGPVDGSMALSDLRTLTISFHAKLADKTSFAHFVISIVNGPKVDNVIFASGAPELRNAIADLAEAKYPQTFPDATPARVIRKATMSCSIYTKGCVVVLLPIGDAAVPEH